MFGSGLRRYAKEMAELVTVPYLGTAEEDVLVADWLVDVGERFAKGQAIVVLETLKASFEVEAEADGVLLRQIAGKGGRVPLHAALGVRGEQGEVIDEAALTTMLEKFAPAQKGDSDAASREDPAAVASPVPASGRVMASPTARRRARELGVDLASIRGSGRGGMITIEDVEGGAGASGAGASEPPGPEAQGGQLDAAFVAHVRADADAFAALSSEFKVALYRRHGARIGTNVVFGSRAFVIAETLTLGDDVRIGTDSRVDAREFTAGRGTQLGARCRFRANKIVLGENAYFAPDAEVGGGGAMDPEAFLQVGSHGFVGEHVHLNPCRPLIVGDEVTISRNASLMTHSFANSVLEGYPNRFAGVTVGDRCQIGIGCSLFPGVTMGEGSILMSNSALVTAMPEGRVYSGSPAEDRKAAREVVDDARRRSLARRIVLDFAAALEARGYDTHIERAGEMIVTVSVTHEGAKHVLRFGDRVDGSTHEFVAEDLRIGVQADATVWDELGPELCGFDLTGKRLKGSLGPMGAAFREFLRKRGIRLEPRTWTYPGGWL